ncbi:hypothetical protein HWV62_26496 [Athelia sp. TMB]|nr:hypothetical protein HWV62_26496 [Athelia sp. TMB]
MTRALRARKSRPNYSTLLEIGDEDDAEPSTAMVIDNEVDSGSEFEADKAEPGSPEDLPEDEEIDEDSANDDIESLTGSDRSVKPLPKSKGQSKAKAKTLKAKTETQPRAGPSLSRGSSNKMYSLPTVSIHHRHRAVPLYFPVKRVDRLTECAKLFTPSLTTSTNNLTTNMTVQDRVHRGLGYNVGPGPLWEMLEDRAWYKEAIECPMGETVTEAHCRPRVHTGISLNDGWEVIDEQTASPFLPFDNVASDDGILRPSPPVICSFGPHDKQMRVELPMYATRRISEFISESRAHVFNAGAPVWGLDWCPIHPDERETLSYTEYLAVAPFPSRLHSPNIGAKVARPSKACIQIWSLASAKGEDDMDDDGEDRGQMQCALVLCIDVGPAYELKWCPLPSHDKLGEPGPRKLGLVAGTFEDGSLSIYAVPHPASIAPYGQESSLPVYGNIAVFNIKKALETNDPISRLPTHYFNVHQSAIRALTWIRAPPVSTSGISMAQADPTVIASGGHDGMECITDLRAPQGNIINRTRDVIPTATYTVYGGGVVTIDHENTIKAYSASAGMLGRGHALFEPNGPVWSAHASDFHPQIAVGSADGTCITTNSLRNPRRGGTVPWLVHKIYQLDYNRTSGELRMLEKFAPAEPVEKPTTNKAKAKLDARSALMSVATGVWPPIVGVHRVVWNSGNGFNGASLLASGTASGLCRVDNLRGRWIRDRIPYCGIENIRMEDGAAGGDDEEEDMD